MAARFSRFHPILASMLASAAVAASCGGGSTTGDTTSTVHQGGHGGTGQSTGGAHAGGSGGGLFITSSSSSGGGQQQGFDVQPSTAQTITVNLGQTMPQLTYTATLDGKPINAGWSVDQGAVGSIPKGPSTSAVFSPSGTTGGTVNVRAVLNNQTVQRQILVKLVGQQNGPNPNSPLEAGQIAMTPADLTAGGGIGGVGGEGLGVTVSDAATIAALGAPGSDGSAQGLKYLYPYDKTVWPRGLLAPLLQWESSLGDADAIQIELSTTTGSFSWKGTFAKPAILAQTGGKFVRHPIPQDIWQAATNTASGLGDQLTVKLTVALGGQAYGPIAETWTVAPARLSGTIYYNSYGTQLAQNDVGAVGGNKKYGGAVLSIRAGDPGPKLVAGADGTSAQCRVCHSVAANGARLIVQHGDNYGLSAAYDLTSNGTADQALATSATFPGVFPDGSLALSPSAQLISLPAGTVIPSTGLTNVSNSLGTPSFSPDGKLVVFNPMAGAAVTNPTQQLMVMSFDVATSTFSNPVTVVDDNDGSAATRPGWPAFFPDGKAVVYQQQTAAGVDGLAGDLHTRKGAKGYIAWTSVVDAASVKALDRLNGKDAMGNVYLPKLAQPKNMACTGDGTQVGNMDPDHGDDVNANYEPTVNPIASGGYAWVVFTSRRMYGSVADIPPFCSDPRGVDLIQNITPKKLWVAAVDVNGQLATDPSHPAFYLPGQELLAGNSRGFWTLDPCRADDQGCESGDQCCNGFCQPNGPNGELVCSDKPPGSTCSGPQEKCTTAADCCDAANVCVNGFCTVKGPS